MFVVSKLLKTTIKTYLGKYILDESQINEMDIQPNGKLELQNIELNCVEINNLLKQNSLGIKVEQLTTHKLCVIASWDKMIEHVELHGVVINLGNRNPSTSFQNNENVNSTLNSTVTKTNSLFYYANQSIDTSVVPPAAETTGGGYEAVMDKLDTIQNGFTVDLKDVEVHMDGICFNIKTVTVSQTEEAIALSIGDLRVLDHNENVVFYIPNVKCELLPEDVDISIKDIQIMEDCSVSRLAKVVSTIVKFLKSIKLSKKAKSEHENSLNMRCNISQIIKLDSIHIQGFEAIHEGASKNGIIKIRYCDTEFINAKNVVIAISKNKAPSSTSSTAVVLSPFSQNVKFYEDGTKKPESASTFEQREAFCEQTKRNALIYLSVNADAINAKNVGLLVDTCKQIHLSVNENIGLFASASSDDLSSLTEEDDSGGGGRKDTSDFFVEIQALKFIMNIPLPQCATNSTLSSDNTHVMIGSHFWSIKSKQLKLLNVEKRMSIIKKVHIAGTLSMDHIVADADKALVFDIEHILEYFAPYMKLQEPEPLRQKLNIHIGRLSLTEEKYAIAAKNLEIVTKNPDHLTITLSRLSGKFDNQKWFDSNLIHINLMENKIKFNMNNASMWVFATKMNSYHSTFQNLYSKVVSDNKDRSDGSDVSDDEMFSPQSFNIIDNYDPSLSTHPEHKTPKWNTLKSEWLCSSLKVNFFKGDDDEFIETSNHISLSLDHFRTFIFEKDRVECFVQSIDVLDGIQSSLWNKALWTGDVKIIFVKGYLSFDFGKEIYLHIDHHFLDYVQEFVQLTSITGEQQSQIIRNPKGLLEKLSFTNVKEEGSEKQQQKLPFHSIHMSEMVFRFDYKPHMDDGMFSFVNCVPIRGSKIVFNEFYLFQFENWSSLANELIVNLLSNVQNLQGLVSGIKPVKPIANIIKKSKNLLILPINNHIGQKRNQSFTKQLKHILRDVSIEVLELGSAMHVNLNKKESIYADQPGTWKEGLSRGKQQFDENCDMIIALVRNAEETDLVHLPLLVVRPFTGFMSQFFLGLANQLNPKRKQIMDNKYKTKMI